MMKKLLLSIFILGFGFLAQARSPGKIETKSEVRSVSFSMAFDAKTIEQYRLMAVDQAKGQALIEANQICEEQMHGHIYLNSRLFAPEKCLLESTGATSADFICDITAINYCLL